MSNSGEVRQQPAASDVRFDIQGLRAFAVLAVVVYHLWPNRLSGGFVGVDVFFVISGYLITGHLLREVAKTGRIALASFWSRRAKRLLPSAFLVLVATGVAVLIWVPKTVWQQYFSELIASTLYAQNWRLAASSVDYLASFNSPSPFQHFWSLSVEEQFYIGLPVLLVLVFALGRRGRLSKVGLARALLVAVIVVSFVWCLVQTTSAPGIAYFSTATRAWEFALGGLASTFVVRPPAAGSVRAAVAVGPWVGAALLLVSLVVITPASPFPGYVAALPVVGAALVVLLGGHSGLARVGRLRPVAFLGRISYSLYLWHWPAIVIVPYITRHALTTSDKLAIAIVAVVIASITTVYLEEPLRFAPRVKRLRPRRVAMAGLATTLVVVVLGTSSLTVLAADNRAAAAEAATVTKGNVACFGAAALISTPKPCVNPALSSVRLPAAGQLATDDSNRTPCWSNVDSSFNVCQLGPKTGYTRHLLAVGDSHNNTLIAAYEAVADKYKWRIDVAGKPGCYWTTAAQDSPSAVRTAACAGWKENATAYVKAHPGLAAVVVTHSTTDGQVLPKAGQTRASATVDGLEASWKTATSLGIPIIAIRDNGVATPKTADCVAQMTGPTTGSCDLSRKNSFPIDDGQAAALARVKLGAVIDLTRYSCTTTRCPAVVGGVIVHRDRTHYTATFVKTLAPYLGADLVDALHDLHR